MNLSSQLCLALYAFIVTLKSVESINCYQCISTQIDDPFQCDEQFDDTDIQPKPCDDVYGAQYCIKQIGRFEVTGIKCFQCSAPFNISCSDLLISDGTLQPEECDTVFEAEYCIKATGRAWGGGIGTKRFCSSLDLGNYCNYVQQPGDNLEYRSCLFTCTGDGCNSGNFQVASHGTVLFFLTITVFLRRFFL